MGVLIIFAEFSGIPYSFVDSSIAHFSMMDRRDCSKTAQG
jgi:hypothetical protein